MACGAEAGNLMSVCPAILLFVLLCADNEITQVRTEVFQAIARTFDLMVLALNCTVDLLVWNSSVSV